VWNVVSTWIEKNLSLVVDGWNHFVAFGDLFNLKDDGQMCHLIWLATTWNIWKHINNVIFNGILSDAKFLIDEISDGARDFN
jgi:hypothetical protein